MSGISIFNFIAPFAADIFILMNLFYFARMCLSTIFKLLGVNCFVARVSGRIYIKAKRIYPGMCKKRSSPSKQFGI